MAPRLVLVGPPGSGKSSVGLLVARLLHERFADVDQLVEQREGRSISDIFIQDGEPAFRALERVACADLIAGFDGVVALGGGSLLDPDTEASVQPLTVAFLDVAIADAARRIGFAQSRPLLSMNPRAQWTQLMAIRRPVYQRVATFTVDTAGLCAETVARKVVDTLRDKETE